MHCVILGARRFRNVRRLSPESQCCCRLSAVCSCKACHQATSKQNKVCKCEYARALDKYILVTMRYACSIQVTIHGLSWPPVCSCKSCHQPSKAEHASLHIPCKSACTTQCAVRILIYNRQQATVLNNICCHVCCTPHCIRPIPCLMWTKCNKVSMDDLPIVKGKGVKTYILSRFFFNLS